MDTEHALEEVFSEYKRASNKFSAFASSHEGLAIVQEEFEELKAEVFKNIECRDRFMMAKEAKHLAAMAIRFLIDVC